jgi:hypothetical protein
MFWRPSGMLLMNWLLNGETFNSECWSKHIWADLWARRPFRRNGRKKSMIIIHTDGAKLHCPKILGQKMAELGTTNAPHPALGPNVVLSGFRITCKMATGVRK